MFSGPHAHEVACVLSFRGQTGCQNTSEGMEGLNIPRWSRLSIKGPGQGQVGRGVGDNQCVGRWWGSTQFLTLAVSLPDHDVALVTLAVVGALCVGASSPMARPWLLTLVYVCKHREKARVGASPARGPGIPLQKPRTRTPMLKPRKDRHPCCSHDWQGASMPDLGLT